MFFLSQLLLVLSAYILLLALHSNSHQFLISSTNACLCWASIFLIITRSIIIIIIFIDIDSFHLDCFFSRLPSTSIQSIYSHLLYVDHCWFCWKDGVQTVNGEREAEKLCEALQSFSGWYIAFYIGVDQGRTNATREPMKVVFVELLFLISLSVKIVNLFFFKASQRSSLRRWLRCSNVTSYRL